MADNRFASLLLRVAVGIAVTGTAYYYAGQLIFIVLVIPAWGLLLAKPILEFFPSTYGWFKWLVWRKWQGRYYAFYGRQIRIIMDGRTPWLVDKDVLAVIGEKPNKHLMRRFDATEYHSIPGTRMRGFSEKGALRLVESSRHTDARKFKLWMEREVFGPLHKRHAMLDAGAIKERG